MNGLRITYSQTVAFVPLPRELWRPSMTGIPCRCPTCVRRGTRVAFWDTMAVPLKPSEPGRPNATWLTHHPALHTDEEYEAAQPKGDTRNETS